MSFVVCLALSFVAAVAQSAPRVPLDLLTPLIANENEASGHHDCYEYRSQERSDRTGGHMWTERIVEIRDGRVAQLLVVDGKPLTPEQAQTERERLSSIAANPADFIKKGQATHNDEVHARHMLGLLPADFVFDNVRLQDGVWRMDYRPNPAVSPSAIEDQVLHGMSGWLSIDAKQLRLIHIEGSLEQPVTIGLGLVANIHAGSHFSSDRQMVEGRWRTVHVLTKIDGKAALFKNVARNSDITRSDFHYFDHDLSVPEAVQVLLQEQGATLAK